RLRPLEEALREPLSLAVSDGARRVRRIGELAHRMLERAPAELLRLRPFHHPVEKLERALRRRRVGEVGLDLRAGLRGSALEVRRHELVLAAEMLIERRLRRLGLRQDAIDTHSPHALPIEQPIGRAEEAVADTDFGSFRPFPGFLRHPLTLQTDRSTVNGSYRQTGLFSTFPLVVGTFSLAQC